MSNSSLFDPQRIRRRIRGPDRSSKRTGSQSKNLSPQPTSCKPGCRNSKSNGSRLCLIWPLITSCESFAKWFSLILATLVNNSVTFTDLYAQRVTELFAGVVRRVALINWVVDIRLRGQKPTWRTTSRWLREIPVQERRRQVLLRNPQVPSTWKELESILDRWCFPAPLLLGLRLR